MADAILSLNAGSSSLKFSLIQVGSSEAEPRKIAVGKVEGIGTAPHFIVRDADGLVLAEQRWEATPSRSHETFLDILFSWIDSYVGADGLAGVGHRVVHGGAEFSAPVLVTDAVLEQLEPLSPLAPLHQPHNLAGIRAARATRPDVPQIACFDTAFHCSQPAVATHYAIPHKLTAQGIRRYGFHGLSYEHVARRLSVDDPELAQGRVIAAHLGNGASLCAMLGGRSIDTTMGFTALDGLMMGTRCGAIDPGVILYLQQEKGMSPADLERLLYEGCGLLGVSGVSSDMRDLLASGDGRAREAIDLFVYRVARETGALVSVLGGIDGFVFTAGIGENAAEIRALVCAKLAWLGVELDAEANRRRASLISTSDSQVTVRIIPADEEGMIATHVRELIDRLPEEACR